MSSEKFTAEVITWVHTWVPGKLFSFRCTRPAGFRFAAGQFARLGVLPAGSDQIVWRGYSMVSSPYDEHLEFFSIVVEGGQFTGTLETLRPGDTLYVDKTAYGFLTTERFPHDTGETPALWMLASGTGLAPFLSILHDVHVWESFGRLVLVHSVRTPEELAYADTIRELHRHEVFGQYFATAPDRLQYVPVVTRAPGATELDERITALLDNGRLEQAVGHRLDPAHACVMLCGNPEMVAELRKRVQDRGFRAPRRGMPGNLAVENYW